MKKYEQYHPEDFVLEDSFRNWVLNKSPQQDAFWREWIIRHPDMWSVIEEAKEIIHSFQHLPVEVSQEEIELSFKEIEQHFHRRVQHKAGWSNSVLMKVAAAALILIITALGVLYQNQPEKQVQQYLTGQGQRKMVELPDGSRVYMKGNTKLSYFPVWEKRRERRVELLGEAYFQVKEQLYQGNKVKFIVITEDVSIEVVGTEFVVNHTQQHTQVMLNSGKVRLKIKGQRKSVLMEPGDVVDYIASNRKVINQRRDPGPRNTWLKAFKKVGYETAGQTNRSSSKKVTGKTENTPVHSQTQSAKEVDMDRQNQVTPGWSINQKSTNTTTAPGFPEQQVVTSSNQQDHKREGAGSGHQPQYMIRQGLSGKHQKTRNLETILQQGDDNHAYIKQLGENLKSGQTQKGAGNRAEAIFSGENLKDETDDLEWSTHQLQQGEGNISFFHIMESYNTNLYSRQKGSENRVDIESKGFENKGIVLQEGNYNEAMILQQGSFNQAGIDPLTPGVLQQGYYNEIKIMQLGPQNRTQNIQQGNNNTIKVDQKRN